MPIGKIVVQFRPSIFFDTIEVSHWSQKLGCAIDCWLKITGKIFLLYIACKKKVDEKADFNRFFDYRNRF